MTDHLRRSGSDADASPTVEGAATTERSAGALALFRTRDFRNYWYGAASFGVGIWAYITAMGWTALELTDSAFAVSMVNVVYFLPMFVFAIPGGVVADVFDRRRTAITSRAGCAVLALGLAALSASGHLTFAWLLVLSWLVGVTIVSELASRQAYVAQIVPASMVANAFALTAFQGGIARVIGPLVAGWAIAWWGDAGGYGLFTVTNLLFVWFFLRIRVPGTPPGRTRGPLLEELASGFLYLRRNREAAAVVTISVLCGAVGWVYLAMMPIVARDVLGGDARLLGTLGMAVGLGSVPISVYLSTRRRNGGEGRLFAVGLLLWATGVIVFGASTSVVLSVAVLFAAGIGFTMQSVLAQTLLVKLVDRAFHGRVLGLLTLTWGANVIGTLTAGAMADRLGVGTVVIGSGVVIVMVTTVVMSRNRALLAV